MLEYLAPGFLYSLAKDSFTALRQMRRRLSPSEIVSLRQKWKPIFEEKIWESYKQSLQQDVIIRDMKRVDSYPEVKETKGISAWFRAGLMGTYHRGILVGLSWATLMQHEDDHHWRFTNYSAGERGDVKVILLGNIRYEDVESVNWEGDEYYGFPHIYCFFTHKGEPYEHLGYYTERTNPGGLPFYTEVAPYEQVRHLSRKLCLKHAD